MKASSTLVEVRKILIKLDITEYIVYQILEEMWYIISDSKLSKHTVESKFKHILKKFHVTSIEVISTIEHTVVHHFKVIEEAKRKAAADARKLVQVKANVTNFLKESHTLTQIFTILKKQHISELVLYEIIQKFWYIIEHKSYSTTQIDHYFK